MATSLRHTGPASHSIVSRGVEFWTKGHDIPPHRIGLSSSVRLSYSSRYTVSASTVPPLGRSPSSSSIADLGTSSPPTLSTLAPNMTSPRQSRWGGIHTSWQTTSMRRPLKKMPAAAIAEDPILAEQQLPFVLTGDFITQKCQQTGLTETELLTSLLPYFTALARPPISKFRVAAIGVGLSGRAYAGVNLEIRGLPLHHSVHAEQFVVANALQHGETGLKKIVVNHPPCGHCRQFLQELRGAEEISIVIADSRAEESNLQHFLPHRFGPSDLLPGDLALLLEFRNNGLVLVLNHTEGPKGKEEAGSESGAGESQNGCLQASYGAAKSSNGAASAVELSNGAAKSRTTAIPPLAEAALEAANRSYAPYSNSPSGVAVKLSSGEIFAGSYMESAAYNPSLPPLQAALVAMVSESPQASFHDIVETVLVEVSGADVQHASSVSSAVAHLNSDARFHLLHAA